MKKIPRATYRLQFHAGFTFDQATAIADYLSALGISHVYASPYLQAAPGSTHGYDVVAPEKVNEELGGEDGHRRFCKALEDQGLGQILDIVPNHMSVSPPGANKWWWDVLKNGQASPYAGFFDIDWDPPEKRLAGKVVLPVLEDHYGRVLEAGKFQVEITDTRQWVCRYNEMTFPLATESLNLTSQRPGHFNQNPENMGRLLDKQHYRLVFWQAAARDLNYRRFFSINSLAAVCTEKDPVFEQTHARILDWFSRRVIDGVRIDHPDGLKDPDAYFRRLHTAAPHGWFVVEKILHPGEQLPGTWPVAGTTGYDFLNQAGGLFINKENEMTMTAVYDKFIGRRIFFENLAHDCKHLAMEKQLGADICRLTELLVQICEKHPVYRDYTRPELEAACTQLLACMPVYRTYVRKNSPPSKEDKETISMAVQTARSRNPKTDPLLFDFLSEICQAKFQGEPESEFMLRFQQISGPVTAKGIEDMAFYRYNRLLCLNEVGGSPAMFGISAADFHEEMQKRSHQCPNAMLATSTHDTKRSEDVRARLALLSEIPDQWAAAVRRWSGQNAIYKKKDFPDRNIEYHLYQSLAGAWPIDKNRACQYIEKAAREAGEHTCWQQPDTEYEDALLEFTGNILADPFFLTDMQAFVEPLVTPGRINSLSQVLLKLTAPGVPDFYQGTELWDYSLVDPDNRRPVDFALRRRLLESLLKMDADQIMEQMDTGLPKLHVIRQSLALRTRRPELFSPDAAFLPLEITGANKDHAVSYLRGKEAAVIVPRLVMGFSGAWSDTGVKLPKGSWENIFTNDIFAGPDFLLEHILERFPVALLIKTSDS
jgi:(1->4)-alpha-D-glucan 1-alpha-D-glucosylmutase